MLALAPSVAAGVQESQARPAIEKEIRRAHRFERLPVTKARLDEMKAQGKTPLLDRETGELLVETLADELPAGWRLERVGDEGGVRVDSLGSPIVNDTPGLPAWSRRDVDALRAAIAQTRADLARAREQGLDTREVEWLLGNYLGQAIVRAIDVDDIVNIDDGAQVSAAAAASVLEYLDYYENVRAANQDLFDYQYAPTAYPARVEAFAARHGTDLRALQELEPMGNPEPRGGVPSGCYQRSTTSRGMTVLSGQTNIWLANNTDDAQADVPLGFPLFFFYDCHDRDTNSRVRISTNGYLTFFQQGGGAEHGFDYSNDPITSTASPDGFAAPWWDDLMILDQGTPDRVSYKTEGEIGRRVFTAEWLSVSRRNGSTSDSHSFQVKLYEGTDVVEFHYGAFTDDQLDSATIGMESYDGQSGDCGPSCSNTLSGRPSDNQRFTPSGRPSGDRCQGAMPVYNGTSIEDTLYHATPDGASSCGNTRNNRDRWYRFRASCTGTLTVSACGSRALPGVGLDTVLSIHSGCPGTADNELACNDDAPQPGCISTDSSVSAFVTIGQEVYIRVTHFGNDDFRYGNGRYRLSVELTSINAPFNDTCQFARPVSPGANEPFNLTCASNDGGSECVGAFGNPDVWFQFTAPTAGRLTVDTCGSGDNSGPNTGPDTILSIHSDCPGTGQNELACNDDSSLLACDPQDSRASIIMTAGQRVFIRVSHFGSGPNHIGNGQGRLRANFFCIADHNNSGAIDSQDFFDFLSDFFVAAQAADVNRDGRVSSQDFFDFLTVFFAGC